MGSLARTLNLAHLVPSPEDRRAARPPTADRRVPSGPRSLRRSLTPFPSDWCQTARTAAACAAAPTIKRLAPSDIRSSYVHPPVAPRIDPGRRVRRERFRRRIAARAGAAGGAGPPARIQLDGNPARLREVGPPVRQRRSGRSDDDLDPAAGRAEQSIAGHHDPGPPRQHGARRRPRRGVRPAGPAEERARPARRAERSRAADSEEAGRGQRRAGQGRQRAHASPERARARPARDSEERDAAEDSGREEHPGARGSPGQGQAAEDDL